MTKSNYKASNRSTNKNKNGKSSKTTTNKKNKLEHTTRIRVDLDRINDTQSLDTSFLEGRYTNNDKTRKKVKDTVLKEKKQIRTKRKRKIFMVIKLLVLLIMLVFIVVILISINTKQNIKKIVVNEEEKVKLDQNYLFIGDNHTVEFNFKEFNLDYHYVKVSKENLKTEEVLKDMKHNIYQYNPSIVFIALGNNELEDKKLLDNLENIINGIKRNRPYAAIYIESLYPINKNIKDFDDDIKIENKDIIEFNKELKNLTIKEKVHYIDVFNELTDKNEDLKEEYTEDGIKLNKKAYQKILSIIQTIVDKENEK